MRARWPPDCTFVRIALGQRSKQRGFREGERGGPLRMGDEGDILGRHLRPSETARFQPRREGQDPLLPVECERRSASRAYFLATKEGGKYRWCIVMPQLPACLQCGLMDSQRPKAPEGNDGSVAPLSIAIAVCRGQICADRRTKPVRRCDFGAKRMHERFVRTAVPSDAGTVIPSC